MTGAANQRASIDELAKMFEEEPGSIDLGSYAIEDWVTLTVFWGMVTCVILQFITRYVLNNSLAWTEEIAASGLVVVVFLGAVLCVRRNSHIQVDLIHRLIPSSISPVLQRVVDLAVLAFFAYMIWLIWRYVELVGHERMITVNVSKAWVFYSVLLAFGLMFIRAGIRLIAGVSVGTTHTEDSAKP